MSMNNSFISSYNRETTLFEVKEFHKGETQLIDKLKKNNS